MAKHRKNKGRFSAADKVVLVGSTTVGMILAGNQVASAQGYSPNWDLLASCESGTPGVIGSANWQAHNPSDPSWGGLQFIQSTWEGFGGLEFAPRGDLATREQQIIVAERVLAAQGPNAWYNCTQYMVPGWEYAGTPAIAPEPVPPAPRNVSGWMWPVDCTMTSGYGNRWGSFHDGADFGCPMGTPIHAAATGVIEPGTGYNTDPGGYGNYIQQRADGGEVIQYGHVSEIYVKVGDRVNVGDIIGAVGSAGSSTGPHLHLRIHNHSGSVDPVWFLNYVGAANTGDFGTPPPPPAPAPDPVPSPAPAPSVTVSGSINGTVTEVRGDLAASYQIGDGDTLTKIAVTFGVSVDGIVDLNPKITNADLIFSGDSIKLLP